MTGDNLKEGIIRQTYLVSLRDILIPILSLLETRTTKKLGICREMPARDAASWGGHGYSCPCNTPSSRSWSLTAKLGDVSMCHWHVADGKKQGAHTNPDISLRFTALGVLSPPNLVLSQDLCTPSPSNPASLCLQSKLCSQNSSFWGISLPPPPGLAQLEAGTSSAHPSLPSICPPSLAGLSLWLMQKRCVVEEQHMILGFGCPVSLLHTP